MRRIVCDSLKDTILDVAGDLLERYGYRKMTIDDIIHEVGIGKGTVYHFFASKEEIALSWFDRMNSRLWDELRGIAVSEGTPTERIYRMLIRRVMFRFDSTQNFRHGLDEIFSDMRKSFFSRRTAYRDVEISMFSDVLEEGCRDGEFDIADCPASAESLLLATNSLLPYNLTAIQMGNREEIEAKTMGVANLILKGLIKRS